ncbi:MAG: Rab family GTPase [Promethearchaeota archaeon]
MSEEKVHEYILKLVLLGDPAVGKTSLINQYVDHTFKTDYQPTLGANIIAKEIKMNQIKTTTKLIIWDIAGQKTYDLSRKLFFQGCSGALFIYDITRASTFENIKDKWLQDFQKFGKTKAAFILIGNKTDLTEIRSVKKETGEKLADDINAIDFIETSAKYGENVELAFKKLINQVISDE